MDIKIATKSSLNERLQSVVVGESYEANRIRLVLTKTCTLTFPGKAFIVADDLIELEMMW